MKNKILLTMIFLILAFSIGHISAITYEKADNQNEFKYSSSNYKYNVYLNDASGFIFTSGYKQIKSVKITDINNESKTLENNIDFRNNKTLTGYKVDIDFNKKQLGLNNLKKIEVDFTKQPDLTISKISKNKKEYSIKITNKGDLTAKKNYLGIYIQKNGKYKIIKKIMVPKIRPNKSKTMKIKIINNYNKPLKLFHVDCTNIINETNEENNIKIYK